uniref:Uncharacterized protein n=1 Tax=Haemonchus contortus TaxID=6289 RepID=A0A7I4Y6E7_HAECO
MPLELYNHIPAGGYLSSKFVGRLFPHTFDEKPHVLRRLPAIDLMRLEHAVAFQQTSQTIIDQLVRESTPPLRTQPLLPLRLPVLYQVVNEALGEGVFLEAKDFFIPGPDRRELVSNTRGLLLSVKDLVWVHTVEPTRADQGQNKALKEACIPKANALDRRFLHFFRVKEFTFVPPRLTTF